MAVASNAQQHGHLWVHRRGCPATHDTGRGRAGFLVTQAGKSGPRFLRRCRRALRSTTAFVAL